MIGLRRLTGVLVCVCLLAAAPAAADVVTFWNGVTQDRAAARGVPGLLDFAMVHLAMHDAIQAYQNRYEPYAFFPSSPVSGSPIAAAAAAAHGVLVARFPSDAAALNLILANYLAAQVPDLTADEGVVIGAAAAAAIIANRTGDGSFPSPPPAFFGGTDPGDWRPTSFDPVTGAPVPITVSWMANVVPFALTDPAQFTSLVGPPPPLHSWKYTREYREVKRLGSIDAVLTPEQIAVRSFFSESAIVYWNRTLRVLADTHPRLMNKDSGVKARLFAWVNMAMADAAITAWNSKIHYNFWRPITAIRLGDTDGNPRTVGDPNWTPWLATPNYPDYTSGANNLSGAVTGVLTRFFRTDHLEFSVVGATTSRPYTRISDAAADVVEARILEGIHFRFADTAGRKQGRSVARWVTKKYLERVEHDDHDDDDDGDHDHDGDDDRNDDDERDRDEWEEGREWDRDR